MEMYSKIKVENQKMGGGGGGVGIKCTANHYSSRQRQICSRLGEWWGGESSPMPIIKSYISLSSLAYLLL